MKVQTLPFQHNGLYYEKLGSTIRITQKHYLIKIPEAKLAGSLVPTRSLDAVETHGFRSLLCSLLWVIQTYLNAAAEVSFLQQRVNQPTVADLVQANKLLARMRRPGDIDFGIIFVYLEPPLQIVSVTDAGHASRQTSYAHEGHLILLMSLRSAGGTLKGSEAARFGGPAHALSGSAKKSKRITHSTSFAETLACHSGSANAQLAALRFTEVLEPAPPPRLSTLLSWADAGRFTIPTHCVTDCFDLLELATGERGVPSDKGQRLAILSIREERLTGRCRLFSHVPTSVMLADGLTKCGVFRVLNFFLSTGVWDTTLAAAKPEGKKIQITTRVLTPTSTYDEHTLTTLKG